MPNQQQELEEGKKIHGQKSKYTVGLRIHDSPTGEVYDAADESEVKIIIKLAKPGPEKRVQNEKATLLKFSRAGCPPTIRQLEDVVKIGELANRLLILERLDVPLSQACRFAPLSRPEIKQVAKSVLEALRFVHKNKYIHGDVMPANIWVNNGQTEAGPRFTAIKLAGFGCSVALGSEVAQKGSPLAQSPESHLGLSLGTATDIWSFVNLIINLLRGPEYSIVAPSLSDIEANRRAGLHHTYAILRRMYDCFGRFPEHLLAGLGTDALNEINIIYSMGEPATPFSEVGPTEIPTADRIFIEKIMKLDPAERPTAEELLADEWFDEVSEDTRRSSSSTPESVETPTCLPRIKKMCVIL